MQCAGLLQAATARGVWGSAGWMECQPSRWNSGAAGAWRPTTRLSCTSKLCQAFASRSRMEFPLVNLALLLITVKVEPTLELSSEIYKTLMA